MRYSKDMEAENGHVNFKLVEIFRKGLCNGILKKIVFLFDQGRQSLLDAIMQVLIDLVTVFDALLCWRLQIEDADVCSAPFRSRFLKNSQNNRHHFGRFSWHTLFKSVPTDIFPNAKRLVNAHLRKTDLFSQLNCITVQYNCISKK